MNGTQYTDKQALTDFGAIIEVFAKCELFTAILADLQSVHCEAFEQAIDAQSAQAKERLSYLQYIATNCPSAL